MVAERIRIALMSNLLLDPAPHICSARLLQRYDSSDYFPGPTLAGGRKRLMSLERKPAFNMLDIYSDQIVRNGLSLRPPIIKNISTIDS
jgi:hypothetical protein